MWVGRIYTYTWGFPGGTVVENPPVNAGDTGDVGSVPGMGSPLEEEVVTHSSILAWKIPWTEEPGGLHSMGLQRVIHIHMHIHTHTYTHIYKCIHTHIHMHAHIHIHMNTHAHTYTYIYTYMHIHIGCLYILCRLPRAVL